MDLNQKSVDGLESVRVCGKNGTHSNCTLKKSTEANITPIIGNDVITA